MTDALEVQAPIAVGELIDKISILEIKAVRIADPAKRAHVHVELAALIRVRDAYALEFLNDQAALLKAVNEALWDVEDELRVCERRKDFGPRFIELARSVYRLNEERAALKREANRLSGSRIVEQKSYAGDG